jgi:ABC-type phosphate transport system substrate-binding protein
MRRIHRTTRRWLEAALLCVVLAVTGATIAVAGEPAAAFQVVIHPENAATSLSREFVAGAFLGKTTRWSGGEAISPVDLRFEAPARARFCEQVLRRSVFAVRAYWHQRIFAGRGVPPPELDTDEAVLRYVASRRGAVGYVSGQATTAAVKVVAVH